MFILNKKRITLIVSSVFLSVFIFILSQNSDITKENYISTVNLPASGKTVVVDAGHGVPDEEEKLLKSMDITQQ